MSSFNKERDTAKCCDCKKRYDLCYFMCEDCDQQCICVKCYIGQMMKFASEKGFVPTGVKVDAKMFYKPDKSVLDDFGLFDDYYPDSE